MPGSAAPTTLDPPSDRILKREPGTLVWRETGPDGHPRVVKLYRRRGPMTVLRSRLTRFRAEREYRRLSHLQRWGVRCTQPLGWSTGRSEAHGRHEALVMRAVPGAVPLSERLPEDAATELVPLFQLVRRMHESGFCHQTLYARNVLVSPEEPPERRYFVADVPRSWTFPRRIVGTRMAWFDLLDLVWSLREAGLPPEHLPVEAYADSAEGLWPQKGGLAGLRIAPDPRSKRMRLMRDLAARIRWAAAWAGAWVVRGGPHRPQ